MLPVLVDLQNKKKITFLSKIAYSKHHANMPNTYLGCSLQQTVSPESLVWSVIRVLAILPCQAL